MSYLSCAESDVEGRGRQAWLLRVGTLFPQVLPPRGTSACSGKVNGQELEPAENVFPRPQVQPLPLRKSSGEFKGILGCSQSKRQELDESLMDGLRFNEKIPNCP